MPDGPEWLPREADLEQEETVVEGDDNDADRRVMMMMGMLIEE